MKKWIIIPVLTVIILFTACGHKVTVADLQVRIDSLQTALDTFTTHKAKTDAQLLMIDSADYKYYDMQQWDRFSLSHSPDVRVFYPDGGLSVGLPQHIDMLKPMFEFAPDTKIFQHRTSFGSNDWTTVIQEIQGTFTDTLKLPTGKTYLPTGKQFMFLMCTVAHWKDGKMMDKYLFWDNEAFMKQIGVIQ